MPGKFKFTGFVELGFQISFKPFGTEVARLAEYLQEAVEVRLEPSSEELDLGGAG